MLYLLVKKSNVLIIYSRPSCSANIRKPGCTTRGTISIIISIIIFFYISLKMVLIIHLFIYFVIKSWLIANEKAKKINENTKLSL